MTKQQAWQLKHPVSMKLLLTGQGLCGVFGWVTRDKAAVA